MRPDNHMIEPFRQLEGDYGSDSSYGNAGQFFVPCNGSILTVVCSDGEGWDHVSVSTPERCPRWEEMEYIKRMFFLPNEVAMQLHVPVEDHISNHDYCLHIWRPQKSEIPLPPKGFV